MLVHFGLCFFRLTIYVRYDHDVSCQVRLCLARRGHVKSVSFGLRQVRTSYERLSQIISFYLRLCQIMSCYEVFGEFGRV
jgi:hypothetical protein